MAEKENKLILYKDDEGKLIVNTLFADVNSGERSASRPNTVPGTCEVKMSYVKN